MQSPKGGPGGLLHHRPETAEIEQRALQYHLYVFILHDDALGIRTMRTLLPPMGGLSNQHPCARSRLRIETERVQSSSSLLPPLPRCQSFVFLIAKWPYVLAHRNTTTVFLRDRRDSCVRIEHLQRKTSTCVRVANIRPWSKCHGYLNMCREPTASKPSMSQEAISREERVNGLFCNGLKWHSDVLMHFMDGGVFSWQRS